MSHPLLNTSIPKRFYGTLTRTVKLKKYIGKDKTFPRKIYTHNHQDKGGFQPANYE